MNHPLGLTPCMLWTCVSCVGSVSCQEAACMAAEQAHVRADGPLRYTAVSPRVFVPVWRFVYPLSSLCISLLPPTSLCVVHVCLHFPNLGTVPDVFCLLTAVLQLLPQVLKKDSPHVEAQGMWDVLRRGTSQVLFSDLTEVAMPSLRYFLIILVIQ